jgi:hypothetical protein
VTSSVDVTPASELDSRRSRQPVAWSILAGLAALKLGLHFLSNGPLAYGFMTDELYYLDCTNHLGWGYVDHPPLSIWILWLVRSSAGDGIQAVRLLASISGCATLILAGLMAREMGGGRAAQGLAALLVLCSPLLLAVSSTYTMNALELLLWAVAAYLLLRLIQGGDRRVWVALGVVLGLGLLNKVSMAWFGLGLGLGMLLTPQRRWLASMDPWLAGAVSFALFAPNVAWQIQNGWPMLEFLRNSATVKELTFTSPLEFLAAQLVVAGLPFWLLGLFYCFSSAGRSNRLLGWIAATVFLLLLASGSAKPYYSAPIFPILFAATGLQVERLARSRPRLVGATAAVAAVVGLVSLPLVTAIVPPDRLAVALRALGLTELTVDVTESSPLPQHFAQMFHGVAVVRAVNEAYAGLPATDRERVAVLTGHFGEAGAINVLGRPVGLPRAIGTHVSYWLWGPGDATGEVLIVLSDSESELRQRWAEVERVAAIDCPYCMPYLTRKSIYVVRRPRLPLSEIWRDLKDYS